MSIYTKTGDTGKTSLFGGTRVSKRNPQVEAYGAVDEATCFIGLVYESLEDEETKVVITDIQWTLYAVMAYMSGAPFKKEEVTKEILRIEHMIDELEHTLPKLTRFILPQGSEQTARLHTARSVVRSAERRIIEYVEGKKEITPDDEIIMKYINRLSDFLFMLARKYSTKEKRT